MSRSQQAPASGSLDTQPTYEPYTWLISWGRENDVNHWLEKMTDARKMLEGLHEATETFSPTQKLDWWSGEIHEQSILRYFGCWILPDRFRQGEGSRWVNPNAKRSDRYSDVAVVCECGAVQYSTNNSRMHHGYGQEHTEDCLPQDRLRTEVAIWENRAQAIRQAADYCLPCRHVYEDRFGIHFESFQRIEDNLGIDYTALREDGYRRRRATFIELNKELGATQQEIADAFGMSRGTVAGHIRGRRSYFE